MELRLSPRMFEALILNLRYARLRGAPAREGDHGHRGARRRHAAQGLHRLVPEERDQSALAHQARQGRQEVLRAARQVQGRDRAPAEEARAARGRLSPEHQRHQGRQPRGLDRRGQGAARQEGDGRGQPAPRDLHRQEVHQPRPAVPRPHPGRQHRPHEGGRQVRIPPRLQVLAPTPRGGSARRSPARSPTRRAPSVFRCT